MLSATLAVAADRDLRLIEASRNDDVAAVKTALAAGVDVNAPSGDGATALHWAAQNDDLALADLLIAKGAKTDAATDLGITPLWVAATNSSTAMINRLLAAHADPNLAPPTDGTPLMLVAQQGNVAAVKTLLAHGAHPDAREGARGQTALMWAVSARRPEVVRALLEGHADVKARSTTWTQRMVLCCQLFEGDEAGIAMVAVGGYTPLLFAAQDGDVESTKLLLAAGADPNDAAPDGSSAVVLAAHTGQDDVAKLLLNAGANPNAAGSGYTALHIAAMRGDLALIEALIDHGADLNARQQKGSPTKRVVSGHALDVRLNGATPYLLAVRQFQLKAMKLLVSRGANPSISLFDGRTPLMVLAGPQTRQGISGSDALFAETVKLAVNLGTPVDQADPNGDTALHVAATRRRDAVVQALVDSGAAINVRNNKGETPLTAALTPPGPPEGTLLAEEYNFLVNHKETAELLRKLGGKG
jgi:ankyrin repeat protein